MRRLVLFCLLLLILGTAAVAQNFPRPEFTGGTVYPQTTVPPPRAPIFALLDVGVLLAALALSAFFVLKLRQRTAIFWLALFSIAYFGFYRHGCVCSVGALQNVAQALGGNGYQMPLTVGLFFILPLIFALTFGRVFCSGVCPLGAIQEVLLLKPLKVPQWLDKVLGLIPLLYLGVAVLFALNASSFIICRYDPFVLFYRLGGSTGMLILGVLLLLLAMVVGRPYCRYACPYGVLLRWLAPLAAWRTRITLQECVNCSLCAQTCPYGAIRPPTPSEKLDRRAGRRQLGTLLIVLPLLVGVSAGLLRLSSTTLARVDARVRLAERVYAEEQGWVQGQTLESEAWVARGLPNNILYSHAAIIQKWYDVGSWFLGGWIGLVLGLKLVGTVVRRRRETYEIDAAACVGCGRCFAVCPLDRGVPVPDVTIAGETGAGRS